MASSRRYYVVWRGRRPGVYDSWEACAEQVQGYPNALYRAYPSRALAEKAFRMGPEAAWLPTWALAEPGPERPSLAVDASASRPRGPVAYRGVLLQPRGKVQPVFEGRLGEATVPLGEFLALVRALQWLDAHEQRMPVYTDSTTALGWFHRGGPSPTALERTPEDARRSLEEALRWLQQHPGPWDVRLWETAAWGENPADFGRK